MLSNNLSKTYLCGGYLRLSHSDEVAFEDEAVAGIETLRSNSIENQKEYIDFFSGIGVNSFGYNYPAYVEAMEKQLHRLMHISNYFNTVETR